MISCEKQKQPRQSSSSGDFAIIIKMKIRIKPEVSEMMPTFRPIWIGLISPYANYLWPYDSRQRKKNCHGTHIIEFWEKAAHIYVQNRASHVSILSKFMCHRRNWKRNSRWIKCHAGGGHICEFSSILQKNVWNWEPNWAVDCFTTMYERQLL